MKFPLRFQDGVVVAEGPFDDVIALPPQALRVLNKPGFFVRGAQVIFMAPNGEAVEYRIVGWNRALETLVLQRFQPIPDVEAIPELEG